MTPSAPCRRALKAVVAIETAVSEIDLFISPTGTFNIILEDVNSPLLHDWRSASCTSSTNTKSIRFLSLRYLTFKNGVVGTGNTVRRGCCLWSAILRVWLLIRPVGVLYASLPSKF